MNSMNKYNYFYITKIYMKKTYYGTGKQNNREENIYLIFEANI